VILCELFYYTGHIKITSTRLSEFVKLIGNIVDVENLEDHVLTGNLFDIIIEKLPEEFTLHDVMLLSLLPAEQLDYKAKLIAEKKKSAEEKAEKKKKKKRGATTPEEAKRNAKLSARLSALMTGSAAEVIPLLLMPLKCELMCFSTYVKKLCLCVFQGAEEDAEEDAEEAEGEAEEEEKEEACVGEEQGTGKKSKREPKAPRSPLSEDERTELVGLRVRNEFLEAANLFLKAENERLEEVVSRRPTPVRTKARPSAEAAVDLAQELPPRRPPLASVGRALRSNARFESGIPAKSLVRHLSPPGSPLTRSDSIESLGSVNSKVAGLNF
jgi:hypothetical protein